MAYNNAPPPPVNPEDIPENYVDMAEARMRQCYWLISTSKLRNLLSMITDCYYSEKRSKQMRIADDTTEILDSMRVRVANEIGRDKKSGDKFGKFARETKLQEYLKGIRKDRKAFLRFFGYMEALVAYHKYMGGNERDR